MILNNKRISFLVTSVAIILLLLVLAVWQFQKLGVKLSRIAVIEQALTAEPVPFVKLEHAILHYKPVDYVKVTITGGYRHDLERLIFDVYDGMPGWRVVTPFISDDGAIILVDRGFVPDRFKDQDSRPDSVATPERAKITGYARRHARSRGFFTPANEPIKNMWYAFDLDALLASLPQDLLLATQDRKTRDKTPYFFKMFVQLAPDTPADPVISAASKLPIVLPPNPKLHNNHKQYALTWLAMALIVAVMTVLIWRKDSA